MSDEAYLYLNENYNKLNYGCYATCNPGSQTTYQRPFHSDKENGMVHDLSISNRRLP